MMRTLICTSSLFSIQEVRKRNRDAVVRPGSHDVDQLRSVQQDNHDVLAATDPYETTVLKRLYSEINTTCFDGELETPLMILSEPSLNHLMADVPGWDDSIGDVAGYCDQDPDTKRIVILLVTGMSARELIDVLAHEMVHQYLAQKHGYAAMCKIGHSAVFYAEAPRLLRYFNTKLIAPGY